MSEHVKEISSAEFTEKVIKGDGLILVDFWAPWCGPCRMVAPMLEQIAEEMKDQVTIYKLNVDSNGETAIAYGVSGIPTFILYKGGDVVARHVGAPPKHDIEELIKKNV